MLFNEMNLITPLQKAVEKAGYLEPTPIQKATIPSILAGKDILGCAQTGTGKTAAFALPILQLLNSRNTALRSSSKRPVRALILTPTRELALQIYENFETYGADLSLRSVIIFGGVSQNPQVQKLEQGVDILVATPGRLNDLIRQGFVKLDAVEIFVLDEADRMLDMGFLPDIKRVVALLPQQRQTLLFSATMPKEIESLAMGLLKNPETVKMAPVTSTVDTVSQSVYFINKDDKIKLLLELLQHKGVSSALIFTRTKHGADQVVRNLTKNKINAMAIHGNKSQSARQTALSSFKNGKIDVLVATDIAARGIDIAELPFVINYNVPEEAETYIHRIGRTGRAGHNGVAISFCCSDEKKLWQSIEKLIERSVEEQECVWSVKDMQATTPPPRTGNRPRRPASGSSARHSSPAQGAARSSRGHESQHPAAAQRKNISPKSRSPRYKRNEKKSS